MENHNTSAVAEMIVDFLKNNDLSYTNQEHWVQDIVEAEIKYKLESNIESIIDIIESEKYGGGNIDRDEFKSRILEKIRNLF